MNRAEPPAPKQGFFLKILSLIEVCLLGAIGLILGALLLCVAYACEIIKHIAEKKSRRKTQHLAEEIRQRAKAQQERKREETSSPGIIQQIHYHGAPPSEPPPLPTTPQ